MKTLKEIINENSNKTQLIYIKDELSSEQYDKFLEIVGDFDADEGWYKNDTVYGWEVDNKPEIIKIQKALKALKIPYKTEDVQNFIELSDKDKIKVAFENGGGKGTPDAYKASARTIIMQNDNYIMLK